MSVGIESLMGALAGAIGGGAAGAPGAEGGDDTMEDAAAGNDVAARRVAVQQNKFNDAAAPTNLSLLTMDESTTRDVELVHDVVRNVATQLALKLRVDDALGELRLDDEQLVRIFEEQLRPLFDYMCRGSPDTRVLSCREFRMFLHDVLLCFAYNAYPTRVRTRKDMYVQLRQENTKPSTGLLLDETKLKTAMAALDVERSPDLARLLHSMFVDTLTSIGTFGSDLTHDSGEPLSFDDKNATSLAVKTPGYKTGLAAMSWRSGSRKPQPVNYLAVGTVSSIIAGVAPL